MKNIGARIFHWRNPKCAPVGGQPLQGLNHVTLCKHKICTLIYWFPSLCPAIKLCWVILDVYIYIWTIKIRLYLDSAKITFIKAVILIDWNQHEKPSTTPPFSKTTKKSMFSQQPFPLLHQNSLVNGPPLPPQFGWWGHLWTALNNWLTSFLFNVLAYWLNLRLLICMSSSDLIAILLEVFKHLRSSMNSKKTHKLNAFRL